MRLGIISDAHHYHDSLGRLCALEIVARQFEQWAHLFNEVIVCAPLVDGLPPSTHTPYLMSNIRLLPISKAGGNSIEAKIDLLKKTPGWWKALHELFGQVEAVHIRCPNNISILGLLALQRTSLFRQAVYTGAWDEKAYMTETLTYRWQRWYLRKAFRGPVAAYGKLPNDPGHVVSSFSPSYTQEDWAQEEPYVAQKVKRLSTLSAFPQPLKLMSVGALDKRKNHQFLIHSLKILQEKGIDFQCLIYGNGTLRGFLQGLIEQLDLQGRIRLCGGVSHNQIREAYRTSDFVIQSPLLEGYGKVPNEAFFHGCIPLVSDVNVSAQIIGGTERGRCFPLGDPNVLIKQLLDLVAEPTEMARLIQNGREHAKMLTLEAWRAHIQLMCEQHWKVKLPSKNSHA